MDRRAPPVRLAAAAIVLGNIVTLPLMIVASGEVSFPVWMFVALLTARPRNAATSPGGQASVRPPGLVRIVRRATRPPI